MNPKRALVIAHEPHGGVCLIGERLLERGYEVDTHLICPDEDRPDRFNPFPDPSGYDLVVPMGSIRTLTDTSDIDGWIHDELELVRAAHERGQPILGVCFGGQVIAAALGGRVELAPRPEIGWFPVDGADNPVGTGPWMQWHHDRFVPPPGAEILATSDVAVQLFRIGTTVGTQFHPEVDPGHVTAWLDGAPPEYLAEFGIEPESLLAETVERADANRAQCGALVDWWLDCVVGGDRRPSGSTVGSD